MILVKDGKREPGHLDMQRLDEFCHMLPEVSVLRSIEMKIDSLLDNTTLWNSIESAFRDKNYFSWTNSSMHS